MEQPKKEDCLIYYTGEGESHKPGYLHGPISDPRVKSEMYAVLQWRAGAKVFKIWEAEKFVSESKNKEFLKIILFERRPPYGRLTT
jgi:hypothetical protein